MEYRIIKEAYLSPNTSTGKTRHFSNGEILPPAIKLQIAQYPEDQGFYLFYLDKDDSIMTDTYHETIIEAMRQAEWEYNIKAQDWELK